MWGVGCGVWGVGSREMGVGCGVWGVGRINKNNLPSPVSYLLTTDSCLLTTDSSI
ncbi:hypothetical protein [Microcystis aeruginosa]|uniref:hypothetical protein n=1 Tax=Microcystis aeruginosa TaxID=1126 RepID=UPI000301CDD7|nr:hypothetical protein [Microcystis aeruginosa]